MIFNTAIPSGGGGSSAWTSVTGVSAPSGGGEVIAMTDGHLCFVSAWNLYPDETGVLLEGMPLPAPGATFGLVVTLIEYGSFDSLSLVALQNGGTLAFDSGEFDPEWASLYTAFTLVYPVASS